MGHHIENKKIKFLLNKFNLREFQHLRFNLNKFNLNKIKGKLKIL